MPLNKLTRPLRKAPCSRPPCHSSFRSSEQMPLLASPPTVRFRHAISAGTPRIGRRLVALLSLPILRVVRIIVKVANLSTSKRDAQHQVSMGVYRLVGIEECPQKLTRHTGLRRCGKWCVARWCPRACGPDYEPAVTCMGFDLGLSRYIRRRARSAGLIPLILAACPKFPGRIRRSFSRASNRSCGTAS